MRHRNFLVLVTALFVMTLTPAATLAAVPPNDDPSTATVIGSLPFSDSVDLSQSTDEVPALPACEAGAHHRVWYAFTPASAETIQVSVGGDPSVELALWTVGSGATDLTLTGCAVDRADLVVTLAAGTSYRISVGLWSSDPAFAGIVTFDTVQLPVNDDVEDATPISSASFTDSLPRATALASTFEAGETYPSCRGGYNNQPHSVWYRVDPAMDVVLTASLSNLAWLAIYDGGAYPGATEVACQPENADLSATLLGGHTYLLQLGPSPYNDTFLAVSLAIPPANDDVADAEVVSTLPFSANPDLTNATFEGGEPEGCGFGGFRSVWYEFTPERDASITASIGEYDAWIAVYTGSSVDALSLVTCAPGYAGGNATFPATAGVSYLVQVGRYYAGSVPVQVQVTPPPTPGFYTLPGDPSSFDELVFVDTSFDAGGQSWSSLWTFGDGSTSNDPNAHHVYAADGTYHVTLAITTTDGRTASTSQDLAVRTHDVAIRKLTAPVSASSGQTKLISVGVVDVRYAESVTVSLWVSTPSGYQYVGDITKQVVVRGANRTTDFVFEYRFTSADALAGKVTFKAYATINGARDALPADNEMLASTKITR